jgi:SpoVK/Ycf46/Vps4 family AAA+-type ATPase
MKGDSRINQKIGDVYNSLKTYHRNHKDMVKLFQDQICRFELPRGADDENQGRILQMEQFLGTRQITNAPRGFRIVLAGYPGCGKTTMAERLAQSYGVVVGNQF